MFERWRQTTMIAATVRKTKMPRRLRKVSEPLRARNVIGIDTIAMMEPSET